jgi:hypothetical protein
MSHPCELLFIAPSRRNVSTPGQCRTPNPPMSLRDILDDSASSNQLWPSLKPFRLNDGLQLLSRYEQELWVLTLLAMVLDVTLTVQGLRLGLQELNPVARTALDQAGAFGLYGLKSVAVLLGICCVLMIPDRYTPFVPLGLALPSVVAVFINSIVIVSVLS